MWRIYSNLDPHGPVLIKEKKIFICHAILKHVCIHGDVKGIKRIPYQHDVKYLHVQSLGERERERER
jgi:hypothetical protein